MRSTDDAAARFFFLSCAVERTFFFHQSTVSGLQHNIRYILSSSRRNWIHYAQKDETKDRKTMLSTLSTTRLDF
ncbi:unnamed protein product [Caenorhabditis auriculariae]|uniref:Uncharacterized protein n=1 Tax=Caenorhabditis auriculariae TaxID=2777116 RepID=A0A8S1H992_9PELO|nr:unnamed protein product [Caenorhabditis auriculariae]